MVFPFLNEIVTIGTLAGVAIGGYFQIIGKIKRDREAQDQRIFGKMDDKTKEIVGHIDERIKVIDSKFNSQDTKFSAQDTKIEKNEEDIQDVEVDMKNMVQEFKQMCDKLSRHDFIIEDIIPDFKALQKEFNQFRAAIDTQLYRKQGLVPTKHTSESIGSDKGNEKNINEGGEIQE